MKACAPALCGEYNRVAQVAPGQWSFTIAGYDASLWDPVPGSSRSLVVYGRLASPAQRTELQVFLRMQPASSACAGSWRADHGTALAKIGPTGPPMVRARFLPVFSTDGSVYATRALPPLPRSPAVRICAWVARSAGEHVRPVTQVIPLITRQLFGATATTAPSGGIDMVDGATTPFSWTGPTKGCPSPISNGSATQYGSRRNETGMYFSQAGFAEPCGGDSFTFTYHGVAGNPSLTVPITPAPGEDDLGHVGNACALGWPDYVPDNLTVAWATAVVTSQGCRVGRVVAIEHSPRVPPGAVVGTYIDGAGVWLAPQGTTVDIATNGAPPTTRPSPTPQPPAAACPAVEFIGARGSGESFQGNGGMGPNVDYMATVLREGLAGSSKFAAGVRTVGVPYPAVSTSVLKPTGNPLPNPKAWFKKYAGQVEKFLRGIQTGVESTVATANAEVTKCPQTELVLSGYSQGAMVIHHAELQLKANDPQTFHRIAGTLLLADGDRVPNTKAHEFGSSLARGEGIRTYIGGVLGASGRSHFPPYIFQDFGRDVPLPATTANICDRSDLVCDFNLFTVRHASENVHSSYSHQPELLAQAVAWLTHILLSRPAPSASARTAASH